MPFRFFSPSPFSYPFLFHSFTQPSPSPSTPSLSASSISTTHSPPSATTTANIDQLPPHRVASHHDFLRRRVVFHPESWWRDWFFYLKHQHEVLSIGFAHKRHPFSRRARLAVLLSTMAFSFLLVSVITLKVGCNQVSCLLSLCRSPFSFFLSSMSFSLPSPYPFFFLSLPSLSLVHRRHMFRLFQGLFDYRRSLLRPSESSQ